MRLRPTSRYAESLVHCAVPNSTSPALQVTQAPHKAQLSHELIAAAASYEAAKAYEKHVSENGQPPNHEKAKELL